MFFFLRMYIMLMFWINLLSYVLIKNIHHYTGKDFISIFLISILGSLTHYYFILYALSISVCIGVIMVTEKRYKEIVQYILVWGGGGLSSYLIFSSMVEHIFAGSRGEDSITELLHASVFSQFKDYYEIIDDNLFGGFLIFIIALIGSTIWLAYLNGEIERIKKQNSLEIKRYLCLLIAIALYFLAVEKSAHYITPRYVVPLFTIMLVCAYTMTLKCLNFFIENEKYTFRVFILLLVLLLALPIMNCKWTYLYSESQEMLDWAAINGEYSDAIVVYNAAWRIGPSYTEISKCHNVTFFQGNDYQS